MTTPLARATAKRAQTWLAAAPPEQSDGSPGATTPAVRAAVDRAMAEHRCDHYTRRPGLAPLCRAVAESWAGWGVAVDPDEGVVISGGVREARFVALGSLAPGRPLWVASPPPQGVEAVLALLGIEARILAPGAELPGDAEGLLLLQPAELAEEEQVRLARWCAAREMTCIADETRAPFFAGDKGYRPFACLPEMAGRTLTLGGFAFLPVLEIWQAAWFAGPDDLVQRVRDLKQAMTICSPAPAQYAALAAVAEGKETRP